MSRVYALASSPASRHCSLSTGLRAAASSERFSPIEVQSRHSGTWHTLYTVNIDMML